MNKRRSIILAGSITTIIVVVIWMRFHPEPVQSSYVESSHVETIKQTDNDSSLTLPGDEILADYGSANLTASDDLQMVSHTIRNFRLLNRQIDARFFATNEDITELLRGKEGLSHQFITYDPRFISSDGNLIDRWGTPLFFHLHSADRIDIRSAGPDGDMFTADDISSANPQR